MTTITEQKKPSVAAVQQQESIKTLVRTIYDLQKLRMASGNRVVASYKRTHTVAEEGMSEAAIEKLNKSILDRLREDYKRLTDGVVAEIGNSAIYGKLPSPKKFKPGEIISTFGELTVVDTYMGLLAREEQSFKALSKVLEDVPIYTEYLSKIDGVGPAIAGIIIAEMDVYKAQYPSSFIAYAGLDAPLVGTYTDDKGKEITLPAWKIDAYFENSEGESHMLADGKYPVTFKHVGRSKKEECLVQREYLDRDNKVQVRNSITYNPFLKTKLIAVLAPSFLRAGVALVDGSRMGASKRLELAESKGFKVRNDDPDKVGTQVIEFLKMLGHDVNVGYSKYGKVYYDYKNKISSMPRHAEKSALHVHNMSLRYCVQRFLIDLHIFWRGLEGLPVSQEYSVAMLGLQHGIASDAKTALRANNHT